VNHQKKYVFAAKIASVACVNVYTLRTGKTWYANANKNPVMHRESMTMPNVLIKKESDITTRFNILYDINTNTANKMISATSVTTADEVGMNDIKGKTM